MTVRPVITSTTKFSKDSPPKHAPKPVHRLTSLPTCEGGNAPFKPFLSRSTTGEFRNSPPKYLRTPKKCPS
eukprot:1445477-Pyramimonas_sp.AAC.1